MFTSFVLRRTRFSCNYWGVVDLLMHMISAWVCGYLHQIWQIYMWHPQHKLSSDFFQCLCNINRWRRMYISRAILRRLVLARFALLWKVQSHWFSMIFMSDHDVSCRTLRFNASLRWREKKGPWYVEELKTRRYKSCFFHAICQGFWDVLRQMH